jgi:hypothetical protein
VAMRPQSQSPRCRSAEVQLRSSGYLLAKSGVDTAMAGPDCPAIRDVDGMAARLAALIVNPQRTVQGRRPKHTVSRSISIPRQGLRA